MAHTFDEVEEWPILHARSQRAPAALDGEVSVLNWNIKFGGGRHDFFWDGWGDRVHLTSDEAEVAIADVAAVINALDPDVVMLQEVDVASKRTAYLDQVQYLLDNTDQNHGAWVPNWWVEYVPEDGLGPVKSGQAVLSKHPLERNTRYNLPQSEDSSAVVNYFWLHRAVQQVEVDLEGTRLTVVNNHPTAYSLDGTKGIHLAEIFDRSQDVEGALITGGDLNVIPPGSVRTEGFADEAEVDTTGVTLVSYSEADMAALEPFYETWTPLLSLEEYGTTEEAQSAWYTHSITQTVFWTQKLDYLFTTGVWVDGWHLQKPGDGPAPGLEADPMALSDHAPMLGMLQWP